ncbi:IS66 family transposase [Methylomonas paludis]|uniref:IS66 family transposase n=2 Tax=Methylomonas paludis TaxID=1173101 RepID=A0A975MKV0_9GAMM|nr:IS66 family transposase [Methylomonas paludis]QWF69449.1 IS66 family transposase [Methylomonas paludis]QWF69609.1 IS66 family transposase [Methylomonas paludis]QWF70483.1 IS66 family transposase [Methylomonas paludis]QWF71831.1 IS66 family transposase [Methylomonas paludis]QWF72176.1 IS66 family transposase [Methylomonas paludis]
MILSHFSSIEHDEHSAILLPEMLAELLEKAQRVDELTQAVELKSEVIATLNQRIQLLEEALRLSKIKRFAPSSEQSGQTSLFDEAEVEATVELEAATDAAVDTVEAVDSSVESEASEPNPPKPKPGRKPFASHLPRKQIFITLSDEEKAGAITTFFTKVKEELDIIPAQVRVLEYMQEKAVFLEPAQAETQRRIIAAALPKHPVPGAMGSIDLMCNVIIYKYCDGLPLYRLENILARYGGELSRATLANWVIALARTLQPLINLIRDHQLAGNIIMADETRVQVLKEPGRPATSDKFMWVTLGGTPGQPSVLFEYDPTRSQEVPLRLLEGFSGYLQTDGYAAYNAACIINHIIQLGCWDHARRKFKEAQDAQPKPKKGKQHKASKADHMLSLINTLYMIERQIKTLSAAERFQQRCKRSLPVLKKLRAYLDDNQHKVPKDSLTGKAMTYMSNQWDKLMVYCSNGELNISNILAENAIRPFVMGRKAWLFSDTPKGAQASAIHYSLIETAKANGLEPCAYLTHVLKALPYADTVEKIEALLPWNLKNTDFAR